MIMFDVCIFSVEKGNFLRIIYDSSYHHPDSIQEDASLYGSDQGVTYNSDDVNNIDSDFEETEKNSHHLSLFLKRRMRMNKFSHK